MPAADLFEVTVERVRDICARLPGVIEEEAWVGTRWKVRSNTFAHVVEVRDARPPSYARAAAVEGPAVVLTFRSSHPELDALVGDGTFFGPLWGRDDVGTVVDATTDWVELAELISESYRLRAPHGRAAVVPPSPHG